MTQPSSPHADPARDPAAAHPAAAAADDDDDHHDDDDVAAAAASAAEAAAARRANICSHASAGNSNRTLYRESPNSFLDICSFNGSVFIFDLCNLYWNKYYESIFHYCRNFWSNEYLRIFNKERFNETGFFLYDGTIRNNNRFYSKHFYGVRKNIFCNFYYWGFSFRRAYCL